MGGTPKGERGFKEDTYWDEHWVLHVNDDSLNSIPEKKKKIKNFLHRGRKTTHRWNWVSDIRQRKTNALCFHAYVEFRKQNE